MTDNRTTEKLMREFVATACECEVRDYLISEYAERIEQAIAATVGSEREKELEELVRDMWREITTCPDYKVPPCMMDNICERIRNLEIEVD